MVMVGKLERKRPLERRRLLCEDNIKIDLKAIGRDDVDWINLAQDRDNWQAVLNTVMNLYSLKCGEFVD